MGWFSEFLSKPFRKLERTFIPENKVTRTLTNIALGAIPGVGPILATGYGALAGSKNVPEGSSFGESILPVATGAVSGYGMGSIGQGLASGITNWAQPGGTSFMTDFSAGFKSGISNYAATPLIPGISKTAPATWFQSPETVGTSLASGKLPEGTGTLLYGGATPETGYMAGTDIAGNVMGGGMPTIQATTQTGKNMLQKIGSAIFGKEGVLSTGGGKLGAGLMLASGIGATVAKPPVPTYNPEEYIKRAKETISKYNLNALPEYAQAEVADMIQIPIEGPELEAKVDDAFARTEQDLEASRETQIQAINQRYSSEGASGDTQQAEDVARVNEYIDAQKAVARGEARATVLAQAYQVKSNALQTVMAAGEFDTNLAYQLAKMIGTEDELNNAIEADDYAQFQSAMASIFGTGLQEVMESIMRKQFPEQFMQNPT